jgi:hypothetical protein
LRQRDIGTEGNILAKETIAYDKLTLSNPPLNFIFKKKNRLHDDSLPNMNFISFEITEICTPRIEATQLVFLP